MSLINIPDGVGSARPIRASGWEAFSSDQRLVVIAVFIETEGP